MELSMYINNPSSNYGGLGAQWGLTEPLADPESYIPKKVKSMKAMAASMLIARQRKTKPLAAKPDNIFWTSRGPTWTQQAKIKGGAKKGLVPPPIPKMRPKVALVRDLPFVDLPPIAAAVTAATAEAPEEAEKGPEEAEEETEEKEAGLEGFGVYTGKKKYLCVLGLLLLGLYLYNRR